MWWTMLKKSLFISIYFLFMPETHKMNTKLSTLTAKYLKLKYFIRNYEYAVLMRAMCSGWTTCKVQQCLGWTRGRAPPLCHFLMAQVVQLRAEKKKTQPWQVWFCRRRRGPFISAMQERQDTPLVSMYFVADFLLFLLFFTKSNFGKMPSA